jgi:predicted Zn-dependent protease
MDQDLEAASQPGCANCGHMIIEHGHPTPLCTECRTKFIKFPIPWPIRIFAGLVLVILVFAMANLPRNLSTAIHYERGKEAIEHSKYATARKELSSVIKNFPQFNDAKEYMVIASFRNQDIPTFFSLLQELEGKQVEDLSLYSEIKQMANHAPEYFPSDSLMAIAEKYHSLDSIPVAVYREYIPTHTAEVFPSWQYASMLFDQKNFSACDSVLTEVLEQDHDYTPALMIKSTLKRELNQLDSSHYYCDRLLSLNNESFYGTASKARTFLKQKKDKEGMDWALRNFELRKNDPYSIATLALAYHFNNRVPDRDKIMATANKDSVQMTYMSYVNDVISGKEKFR